MGKAYSLDLRKRVVQHVEQYGNKTATAKHFQIDRDTVSDWYKRSKEKEGLIPQKPGPKTTKKVDREKLAHYVENNKDKTLEEIGKEFGVSHVAIWKILQQLGYRHKKNISVLRKKQRKTS